MQNGLDSITWRYAGATLITVSERMGLNGRIGPT
jgi:hypothetical protein